MKVTFKPTRYTFEFEDRYFVQAVKSDDDQPFVGAFGEYGDAHAFALLLQQRDSVRAIYIFTREAQIDAWHRPAQRALFSIA